MYQLNDVQIDIVYNKLTESSHHYSKLKEELFDHICCSIENKMEDGKSFEEATEIALSETIPNGIQDIEYELFFLLNYKRQFTMKKLIFLIGFIAVFCISAGFMFKTFHWPGGQIVTISGFALLLITTVIIFFYLITFSKGLSSSFWWRSISGLIAVLFIATGIVMKAFHLPGSNILYGLGTIVLNLVFFPLFFYNLYKNGISKKEVSF